MLEIRLNCENCDKELLPNSKDAMICTFECTFCKDCVQNILQNVCPNCGGGFEKRPVRPKELLKKYTPKKEKILKPVDLSDFEKLLLANKNIDPDKR